MNYPYRECACGNQIHVGGIYECEECLNLEVEEKQIRQMTEKQLLIEILKHLKATPTTDGSE